MTKKEKVYDVEEIVNAEIGDDGVWWYVVKWKGYDETTLEPESHFETGGMLDEFWKTHSREDFYTASMVPKNSLELTTKRAVKQIQEDFRPISKQSDVIEILRPVYGGDNRLYYWIRAKGYERTGPIVVPSKLLHEICPELLIDFFESSVKWKS